MLSHSLPSCQALPHVAKACMGITERTDSPLESWQHCVQPRLPFTTFLTVFSASLIPSMYFFCLRVGKIWQNFPSQWLLCTSANSHVAKYLAHLLFLRLFFPLVGLKNTVEKAAFSFVLISTEAAVFAFRKKKERGKNNFGEKNCCLFCSHEVSVSN